MYVSLGFHDPLQAVHRRNVLARAELSVYILFPIVSLQQNLNPFLPSSRRNCPDVAVPAYGPCIIARDPVHPKRLLLMLSLLAPDASTRVIPLMRALTSRVRVITSPHIVVFLNHMVNVWL